MTHAIYHMPRKLDMQLHSMATCDLSLAAHYPLQETKDHGKAIPKHEHA